MKKLESILKKIESIELDKKSMKLAEKRQNELTKPKKSLGILEDISIQVAGITGDPQPYIRDKSIIVMAGDHGVVEEGVTAYPQEVTAQMVNSFLNGYAAINVFSRHTSTDVVVVDMGIASNMDYSVLIDKKIGYGTKNISKGPAMTRKDAIKAIESGIEVFEEVYAGKKIDIVGTGDMGIGNTTPSSAIISVISNCDPRLTTGRGSGIDDLSLKKKIDVIDKAININKPFKDPIDILAKLGGFEIGGIVGVILASVSHRVPVVIDGFISGAAAAIAIELDRKIKDFMIASHKSLEIGHGVMLDYYGLKPILNLDMRLGEGTGAVLAMSLIELSCRVLNEMKTFDEAGVSDRI
ncbi:MAG: nicotinate-nucleotide--dimethylbenzimidazole phosphoribosyltransferase [Candidatus Methanoliparum thermophilum]|uniref:Nicotinate-nucleotide--dimethylbenzimidazole phosphoribosyltransferase n=1 Tax=Methanoliparum thermophilum TaxID=2491083 RepID=A0A520KSA4_METT2|nr:MAG: nicotinate-nucleotide--dimethylbenzimidazole phosphoribosyltransferase [Candidatus Methanoliparum thermophilum]